MPLWPYGLRYVCSCTLVSQRRGSGISRVVSDISQKSVHVSEFCSDIFMFLEQRGKRVKRAGVLCAAEHVEDPDKPGKGDMKLSL